jgi:type IV pilus assembly protein PilA
MKNLMKKIRKSNKGFTLVELIIVIAIIAILTAVAAPQYIKYVDESRWSKDQNNAASLLTAVQVAIVDNNSDANASNDISSASVSFTKTADISVTGTDADALKAALQVSMGANYDDMRVSNKDATTVGKQAYTITIANDVATGKWDSTT